MLVCCKSQLSDELDNTAGLLDLALGVLAEVTCADDERDLRDATLSEDLAVAEREEVEDWGGVGGLVGEVLLALLNWNEGPELDVVVSMGFSSQRGSSSHTLSRLITGFQNWFWSLWKYRIPTLPK